MKLIFAPDTRSLLDHGQLFRLYLWHIPNHAFLGDDVSVQLCLWYHSLTFKLPQTIRHGDPASMAVLSLVP